MFALRVSNMALAHNPILQLLSMHIPKDISVIVETAQGDVLNSNLPNAPHGEGDYLICTIGEDGGPNLSDVWILNGLIFPNCYDTSQLKKK
jgi:hypothetical protein